MKPLFLLLFFAITHHVYSQDLPAQIKNLNEKIIGHWTAISTKDSLLILDDLLNTNRPVPFKLIEYKGEFYQWGGEAYTGIEFKKNKEFGFFNNVLCSTESSPLNNSGTWLISENNIITITGESLKTFCIKILEIDDKKMTAIFVK